MPGLDAVSSSLTVELLQSILDERLPAKNKGCREEAYDEMLKALQSFGINDSFKLKVLIAKHLDGALKLDRLMAGHTAGDTAVYYGHCGLLKAMLQREVGTGKFGAFRFRKV